MARSENVGDHHPAVPSKFCSQSNRNGLADCLRIVFDEFGVVAARLEEREPGQQNWQQDQHVAQAIDPIDDLPERIAAFSLHRIRVRDLLRVEGLPHIDIGPAQPGFVSFQRRRQIGQAFGRLRIDLADRRRHRFQVARELGGGRWSVP